jgi:threonylcarbamoyladenosine tRNA methylthiotransferase MtaB
MEFKPTVAFHTLGCKLNFSETSTISRKFVSEGYNRVSFPEIADVYVINTCSVTENADKECKKIVKDALKINPEAFVCVVGCYAQLKPEEIAKIDGVDLVLGATEKFKLTNYITNFTKKTHTEIHSCEIEDANIFIDSYSIGDRTRAFLKVQDGCDYTCSYCTIPLARGISRSDKLENVIKNVTEITDKGVKEIVLTGVNIGDYGKGEFGNKKHQNTFLELITELDKIKKVERFRISSIEPNLLKNDIIEFVADSKKFVPHFHIPLQSGSNEILKKMRRRYLKELYIEKIELIKKIMPNCSIGVDVIVGFPGETDELFLETYNFLNELDISYLHVFTYSERDNTDALLLDNIVPKNIRSKRNKMLRILSAKKQNLFYEQNLGKILEVLFESENKNGMIHGFTKNYIKIAVKYSIDLVNQIRMVKLERLLDNGNVAGELIKNNVLSEINNY